MINTTVYFTGRYAKINPVDSDCNCNCNNEEKYELPRYFIVKIVRGTFIDSNDKLHYDSNANPCYSYLDSDGNREINLYDLPRKDGDITIIKFDNFWNEYDK